jgi:hypothetical protein
VNYTVRVGRCSVLTLFILLYYNEVFCICSSKWLCMSVHPFTLVTVDNARHLGLILSLGVSDERHGVVVR